MSKKLIISIFLFFGFSAPEAAAVFSLPLPKNQVEIAADAQSQQQTNQFSPGQTVWVQVTNSGGGATKKQLRVLDAQKNPVRTLDLEKSGSGPYVYSVSFDAPSNPGTYYLDIKIEGGGSSFASQQNITVGEGSGETSVSSAAESVVNTGSVRDKDSAPTAGEAGKIRLPVEPTVAPEESFYPTVPSQPKSFWQQIVDFYRNFLFYLTESLK